MFRITATWMMTEAVAQSLDCVGKAKTPKDLISGTFISPSHSGLCKKNDFLHYQFVGRNCRTQKFHLYPTTSQEKLELTSRPYPQTVLLEVQQNSIKNGDNAGFYTVLCLSKMTHKEGPKDLIIKEINE